MRKLPLDGRALFVKFWNSRPYSAYKLILSCSRLARNSITEKEIKDVPAIRLIPSHVPLDRLSERESCPVQRYSIFFTPFLIAVYRFWREEELTKIEPSAVESMKKLKRESCKTSRPMSSLSVPLDQLHLRILPYNSRAGQRGRLLGGRET